MTAESVHSRLLPAGLLAFGMTACAAATEMLAGLAVEGRSLLVNNAQQNFGAEYTSGFDRALGILMNRAVPGVTTPPPAPAAVPVSAEAEPPEPQPEPEPEPVLAIELEVLVMREVIIDGRPTPIVVQDGDVLKDGIGREGDGDNLKIQFETNTECYVYAMWVDATAWATPIFPKGDGFAFANPVQPDTAYSIPEGSGWFYLDDYRGVENLYILASHEPVPELQETLDGLVGQTRAFRADLDRPVVVTEACEITRGLAGIRPSKSQSVATSDGALHLVASQAFIAEFALSDLVVTRWFRHE